MEDQNILFMGAGARRAMLNRVAAHHRDKAVNAANVRPK
jgi:hypothetical protein